MKDDFDEIEQMAFSKNYPELPAFEIMTIKADPYEDFCDLYNAALSKDKPDRIAKINYNVFRIVEKNGETTYELVDDYEDNLICVMREALFERRLFPFLEVSPETEAFILELTDRRYKNG